MTIDLISTRLFVYTYFYTSVYNVCGDDCLISGLLYLRRVWIHALHKLLRSSVEGLNMELLRSSVEGLSMEWLSLVSNSQSSGLFFGFFYMQIFSI